MSPFEVSPSPLDMNASAIDEMENWLLASRAPEPAALSVSRRGPPDQLWPTEEPAGRNSASGSVVHEKQGSAVKSGSRAFEVFAEQQREKLLQVQPQISNSDALQKIK